MDFVRSFGIGGLSLKQEMYDILHAKTPQDELDFYLSYAEKNALIIKYSQMRDLTIYISKRKDIYKYG